MSSKSFLSAVLGVGFIPLFSVAALGKPAPAAAVGTVLDQKRIHTEYNEGNFDRVIASLEAFIGRNETYSQEDSIFIAKHLAVVYSANPETREKGKYYMHRLLALLPSAKLIDMYVSDEIERIFDKVREEFVARQKAFGVDSSRISVPGAAPSTPRSVQADPLSGKDRKPAGSDPDASRRKRNLKPFYFAAGGAVLVAAGVTTYLLAGDSPEKTERIYDVE